MMNTHFSRKQVPLKYLATISIVLLATGFILASIFLPNLRPQVFSGPYGHLLNHQVIMVSLALLVVLVIRVLFGISTLDFLSLTRWDGPIVPVPWLGIRPNAKETWRHLGRQMALTITLVTGLVIYFQVAQEAPIRLRPDMWVILLLAATNAFSEEVIYRFSFVSAGSSLHLPAQVSELTSALIFGLAHYFGNPGGVPGVLMAGFIGWFLAKSMNETKGFFWAFVIHFVQDVVIFYALSLWL